MSALEERLLSLLRGAKLPAGGDWGVLVRLRDPAGEPLAFAGRITPTGSLEETLREAAGLAASADARFAAAGRALEEEAVATVELFLVREGEAVSEERPLREREGVHVVGAHRRAVYLAEGGRDAEQTLRGGCIAAGLHPDSWQDEDGPVVTRLEVHPIGEPAAEGAGS